MLYYLFDHLEQLDIPGAGMFQYLSFRTAFSIILSMFISMIYGKRIIRYLQRLQIGEDIRDLGLQGQIEKKGTPTMGGIIILMSIIIPVLLIADLKNIYIILMLITTIWMGLIGFVDDYIKVFRKNKDGLAGKFKVLGQVMLGLIVGVTLFLSNDVVIRETIKTPIQDVKVVEVIGMVDSTATEDVEFIVESKSTKTTIPFVKNNEFDYGTLVWFLKGNAKKWGTWLVFILVAIFIVTAVSNGANLTDGIDGLATGTSAIIGTTLGIFAYLSGNLIYSDYLNIMYIPQIGELTVYAGAFVGALLGFMWYNTYPAQVFMGDTGSLSIGGIIAVFAIIVRKELLIPVLCGIFLVESLSVIMQVSYFKYTKKKFGEGRRIFKMSPIHHHFQKKGYHESKIVVRFIIVGILLAVFTVVTLKIR